MLHEIPAEIECMQPSLTSAPRRRFVAFQRCQLTKRMAYLHARYWCHYLAKTRSYSMVRFIVEMTLLAWFLKIVMTLPISLTVLFIYGDPEVWQNPQQVAFAARPVTTAIFALAIAPILETVMGQWAPIAVVKQWTAQKSPALAVATLVFAGLHVFSWDVMIVIATMPIGFVLAWSFIVWHHQSWVYGVGVTAAIHAVHNLIALLLLAC